MSAPRPAVPAGASAGPGSGLALRFALRELRGGLRGFYVFLACIALGVAAIAGVNSVARSITQGIAEQGQVILGGDLDLSIVQQEIGPDVLSMIEGAGDVSRISTMRGMGRLTDGSDQTLVEIKAVDAAYPLYGSLEVAGERTDPGSLGSEEVLVEPLLTDRLGVGAGDSLRIGSQTYRIAGILSAEPDRLSGGFGFGPRVMMSEAGLAASGLVQPGSLVTNSWKVKLDDASPQGVEAFSEELKAAFPDAGWRVRSRGEAAPALSRNIERFSDFLTLVGLTALVVGGVGVANAVRAFLDTKRPVIATFKSLGAPGHSVFQIYLTQIMLIALAGIGIGLVVAAIMPFLAAWALSGVLPLPQASGLQWGSLGLGAIYGLLTALAFAIWPLGAAREVQATDLFRGDHGGRISAIPRPVYLVLLVACVAALVALAIGSSGNRFVAVVFIGAMGFSFLLLRGVAWAIKRVAAAAPHPRSTEWRMAIANIHRPGSLTSSVVLSLGLGLALLVALAMIDANLRQQVGGNLPQDAPDFFFVDIQDNDREAFVDLLEAQAPQGKVFLVPMLRGRIVTLNGIASEDWPATEGRWVLSGDRGITYARNIPENSTLAEGEWWPEDYAGEPLVSFAAEEAGELGLSIGDTITVNVLGRNITARIASLRNVEWESLGINFVMVFSPNTFAGAPHSLLATLKTNGEAAGGSAAGTGEEPSDGDIIRAVARDFPSVTSVQVREALDTVNTLIGQLANAIRAAASVALVASVLVLGGALAAGNRARTHDAVVLKTLGATRGVLTRSFVWEYAVLGLATAVFALVAGGVAAWFVIDRIMTFPFAFQGSVAAATIAVALVATVGFGLIGTWRVLGQKAAPVLREL